MSAGNAKFLASKSTVATNAGTTYALIVLESFTKARSNSSFLRRLQTDNGGNTLANLIVKIKRAESEHLRGPMAAYGSANSKMMADTASILIMLQTVKYTIKCMKTANVNRSPPCYSKIPKMHGMALAPLTTYPSLKMSQKMKTKGAFFQKTKWSMIKAVVNWLKMIKKNPNILTFQAKTKIKSNDSKTSCKLKTNSWSRKDS